VCRQSGIAEHVEKLRFLNTFGTETSHTSAFGEVLERMKELKDISDFMSECLLPEGHVPSRSVSFIASFINRMRSFI